MDTALQHVRDNALYATGYFQGRQFSLTDGASRIYAFAISKFSSLISLPIPFLSFLALPFFGSTSTSISLVFFYLTWTSLVWSQDPLRIEAGGSIAARLLFYLLPSIGFLVFDTFVPSLAASMKAEGKKQLPATYLPRDKLARVAAWSTFNVLLAAALQIGVELILTQVLHMRSLLRISTTVPLPWTIVKDLLWAFALRGVLHYAVHRYILHAGARSSLPFAHWHKTWAHSLRYPFSLAASYDHPVNYLLVSFLPTYIPCVLWRFHVLTYLVFLSLSSLETLLIYSGYGVLPSSIILPGMARRIDAHFASGGKGNFGHWGVMDLICGTGCPGDDSDVVDDVQDEMDKRHVKGKVSGAANDVRKRFSEKGDGDERRGSGSDDHDEDHEDDDEDGADDSNKSTRREKSDGHADASAQNDTEANDDSPPESGNGDANKEGGKRRSKRNAKK